MESLAIFYYTVVSVIILYNNFRYRIFHSLMCVHYLHASLSFLIIENQKFVFSLVLEARMLVQFDVKSRVPFFTIKSPPYRTVDKANI